MKIMLVGGTGVLSKDVAKLCIERNMELYTINRGNNKKYVYDGIHTITGDIRQPHTVASKLDGLCFDVVIDFLSYNTDQLKTTLSIFEGKYTQYVFISTATVYDTSDTDMLISENTPITNHQWLYSSNKIECEEYLKSYFIASEKIYYTIVRPYITYGNNRIPYAVIARRAHWTLIDRILKDKTLVVWGTGENYCTLTHTKDFAVGIVGLLLNKKAVNEDFHITSDESLTINEIVNTIATTVGKEPKLVYIPCETIENTMKMYKDELSKDKSLTRKFDNSKIKVAVDDFECSISFVEGIKDTIKNYSDDPSMCKTDMIWNYQIELLINGYRLVSKEVDTYNLDLPNTSKSILYVQRLLIYIQMFTYKAIRKLKRILKLG